MPPPALTKRHLAARWSSIATQRSSGGKHFWSMHSPFKRENSVRFRGGPPTSNHSYVHHLHRHNLRRFLRAAGHATRGGRALHGSWAGASLSTDLADWRGAGFQNRIMQVRLLRSVPSLSRLTEGCRSTEPTTMVRIHPQRPHVAVAQWKSTSFRNWRLVVRVHPATPCHSRFPFTPFTPTPRGCMFVRIPFHRIVDAGAYKRLRAHAAWYQRQMQRQDPASGTQRRAVAIRRSS